MQLDVTRPDTGRNFCERKCTGRGNITVKEGTLQRVNLALGQWRLSDHIGAMKLPNVSSEINLPHISDLRIVIADDDPLLRVLYSDFLLGAGAGEENIAICKDGIELLDYLRVNGSDVQLIISDRTMPNMTGPEALCAAIDGGMLCSGVKIIICSGHADLAKATLNGHATRYFPKPFSIKDLGVFLNSAVCRLDLHNVCASVVDNSGSAKGAPDVHDERCPIEKARLVIIESDREIRDSLKSFLSTFGFNVHGNNAQVQFFSSQSDFEAHRLSSPFHPHVIVANENLVGQDYISHLRRELGDTLMILDSCKSNSFHQEIPHINCTEMFFTGPLGKMLLTVFQAA